MGPRKNNNKPTEAAKKKAEATAQAVATAKAGAAAKAKAAKAKAAKAKAAEQIDEDELVPKASEKFTFSKDEFNARVSEVCDKEAAKKVAQEADQSILYNPNDETSNSGAVALATAENQAVATATIAEFNEVFLKAKIYRESTICPWALEQKQVTAFVLYIAQVVGGYQLVRNGKVFVEKVPSSEGKDRIAKMVEYLPFLADKGMTPSKFHGFAMTATGAKALQVASYRASSVQSPEMTQVIAAITSALDAIVELSSLSTASKWVAWKRLSGLWRNMSPRSRAPPTLRSPLHPRSHSRSPLSLSLSLLPHLKKTRFSVKLRLNSFYFLPYPSVSTRTLLRWASSFYEAVRGRYVLSENARFSIDPDCLDIIHAILNGDGTHIQVEGPWLLYDGKHYCKSVNCMVYSIGDIPFRYQGPYPGCFNDINCSTIDPLPFKIVDREMILGDLIFRCVSRFMTMPIQNINELNEGESKSDLPDDVLQTADKIVKRQRAKVEHTFAHWHHYKFAQSTSLRPRKWEFREKEMGPGDEKPAVVLVDEGETMFECVFHVMFLLEQIKARKKYPWLDREIHPFYQAWGGLAHAARAEQQLYVEVPSDPNRIHREVVRDEYFRRLHDNLKGRPIMVKHAGNAAFHRTVSGDRLSKSTLTQRKMFAALKERLAGGASTTRQKAKAKIQREMGKTIRPRRSVVSLAPGEQLRLKQTSRITRIRAKRG